MKLVDRQLAVDALEALRAVENILDSAKINNPPTFEVDNDIRHVVGNTIKRLEEAVK